MISADDFVLFCNRTLDGYERAIARLDDAQLNELPPGGGNTVAQWVSHAMGAVRFWTAHVVCGEASDRDRDAEFIAQATGTDLGALIATFRSDLAAMHPTLAAATEVVHSYETQIPLGHDWDVGTALLHAYEELAQHLGHAEITADVILA